MDDALIKLSEFRAQGFDVSFVGQEISIVFAALPAKDADGLLPLTARLTCTIKVRLLPHREYSLQTTILEGYGGELSQHTYFGRPKIVREGLFLTLRGMQPLAFDSSLLLQEVESKLAEAGYTPKKSLWTKLFNK